MKIKDGGGIFDDFMRLGFGEDIVITSVNRSTILSICQELNNVEFCELLIGSVGSEEEMTVDKAIE
jgi:hypothetical protein